MTTLTLWNNSNTIEGTTTIFLIIFRYHGQIGFVNFKKHLIEYSWNKYQVAVPELLKRLRAFKKNSEGEVFISLCPLIN
jgi:hypothetical protein